MVAPRGQQLGLWGGTRRGSLGMRVTSTRTGQSRLLRIRTGKLLADLLIRLTAEEGLTVTEDSMVVTYIMAVAESSCSEGTPGS